MSPNQFKNLQDGLDLLIIIVIFIFSVSLVESLRTKQDRKDNKKAIQRPEPLKPQSLKSRRLIICL